MSSSSKRRSSGRVIKRLFLILSFTLLIASHTEEEVRRYSSKEAFPTPVFPFPIQQLKTQLLYSIEITRSQSLSSQHTDPPDRKFVTKTTTNSFATVTAA
ncbi:hypothetical protein TNCT_232551 [Trichonephila clavata]|uniref:Uncharacterized protein n=1 Tax=Trichonephila clavata TaxID=2740835 RepID=A0A8X6GZZ2_TRICU|nr:hypothetical protein TNCT_232551 [Trichonephila clavata]